MDKQEIFDTLRAWAVAKKAAGVNARLIVESNFKDSVMKECAERMKTLGKYEQELYDMEGQKDLPAPLETFLRSRHDMGCTACMYSSAGPQHAECRRKINHYFKSEEALCLYVAVVLTD